MLVDKTSKGALRGPFFMPTTVLPYCARFDATQPPHTQPRIEQMDVTWAL